MKYFSIPADFKTETIDKLYELNNMYSNAKVIETYGQVTIGDVINSGRIISSLPDVGFKKLEEYVKYSKERDIKFNYTLNPSCFGNYEFSDKGAKELMSLLYSIYNIGVESLTVTSPALMELVKGSGIPFKIKSSAICEVNSPTKALYYKNLGVRRVVVDPDITRDFRKLKNICTVFGEGVEILINNVCYKNCAYKMFHYNHDAHCTPSSNQCVKDYYFYRCFMQKANHLENVIKLNWIRPEDLHFYSEIGIHYFKIQGRQNVVDGDIIKTLKAYIEEDFDGNLYDLLTLFAPYNNFQTYINNKKLDGFVETFYIKPDFCTDMCDKCHYCEGYAKKSMDVSDAEKVNQLALMFYSKDDKYTKLVAEAKASRFLDKSDDSEFEDANFDFE